MKNLKLFVFALCAVLLSVVTVNANTCNLPGENVSGKPACVAKVNGVGFDTIQHAWTEVTTYGGTLELLGTNGLPLGSDTITKNITINGNGNSVTAGSLTVAANGSLTIENAKYSASGKITNNGLLTLNNVVATITSHYYVHNYGTTVVNGGSVDVTGNSSVFVNEKGSLTLNNLTKITAKSTTLLWVKGHDTRTVVNGGIYDIGKLFASPDAAPKKAAKTDVTKDEVAANLEVKAGTVVAVSGSDVNNGMNVTFENADYEVTTGDALTLTKGNLNVIGGEVTADADDGIVVFSSADEAKLNVTGGKVVSTTGGYALALNSTKATYAISGGTFESKGTNIPAAIWLANGMVTKVNGKVVVNAAIEGILTGGKYLNNIIAKVDVAGGTYDVSTQLVAKNYTVKTEDPYKVVVSTKATEETTKPGAPGKEEAPNTFDAGLVYMGLALSAIGASVVSVRKLRNN